MIRFLPTSGQASRTCRTGWWPRRARTRGDDAADRLRCARAGFDDSVVALRKAALDHVDCQDLASTALRANLNRLAQRLGAT